MPEALDLGRAFDPVDRETWREHVEAGLRGAGLESLRTVLDGGLAVEPLYDAEDLPAVEGGRPGAPPFTRGATGSAEWRLVAAAGGRDAEALVASAARARRWEADAVHLSADACARLDRDALARIGGPVILEPGAAAPAWLAAASSIEGAELRFDPLGALASTGQLPYGLARARRWLAELATEGRRVLVDGALHHDAGAPAADELGVALAIGAEYLRWLAASGHPLADAPARIVLALACDDDVFLTIAKLRAARLCWSKVLRATGIDGEPHGLRIHARESGRVRTCLEPRTGALRSTAAAFGAVAGGAQDVTLTPFDETVPAERLAITTQHVLRVETHLGRVVDPAGGAYYVEALTDRVARAAWAVLAEIEAAGGAERMLLDGRLAARHAASAAARRARVATRRVGRVGVNRYASPEDPPPEPSPEPMPAGAAPPRPEKAVRDALRDAPRGALSAALRESTASVASIEAELRRSGDAVSCPPLAPLREAAPFEALRRRAAALPEARRRALLYGVGDPRAVQPRMDFAREALLTAGLRPEAPLTGAEPPPLAGAPATVIVCATAPLAPLVAAARSAGAVAVLVAGPDEAGSGADGRLHRDMDAVDVLGALLARLEAR